jgi:hypothetical protein
MREQGESAGQVDASADDLLPSEDGAALLIDRGLVDEDRFCEAVDQVFDAEADPEAEAAFARGWRRSASGELAEEGATMYQALSTGCLGS